MQITFSKRYTLVLVISYFCLSQSLVRAQVTPRPFHIQHEFRKDSSLFTNATSVNPKRKKWSNRIALGGYALSMLYLGTAWYANEELGHFRFFNDWREWQQMDKVGHVLGGYTTTRLWIDLYRWSGVPKKQAIIHGAIGGFLIMNSIEVLDGFAEKWGASVPDVGANLLGTSLAVMNQALWNENRLQLKVSYIRSDFAGQAEYEDLFGTTYPEWFLKDYNGQTLWLSVRVHSFLPEGTFKDHYPRWLNLAIGYGAEGLVGGYGEDPWDEIEAREYRQLFLSLDIDLSNIRTRSGFLHTLFNVVNIIRIPLPALQIDRNGLAFKAFQ